MDAGGRHRAVAARLGPDRPPRHHQNERREVINVQQTLACAAVATATPDLA